MKKYLYIALAGIIIFTSSLIMHQRAELTKYKGLYSKELQNVEAYRASNSGLEEDIREFRMSINDLRASRDSIDRKLAETIDKLKVKDKNIEYLQYQVKTAQKVDTIALVDTIFVPETHLDTLLKDQWYSLRLQLDYPATIVASPSFTSEQFVVINTKKEYNNPPSKIFFIRWFQKKHWVTEVNVIERSPYIDVKQQKYIKVVK